ncbi:hypothetical protein BDB00DRAFT_792689 [Zychaea mexicana]|uniref:uncharacterized protein n=1 Tax=Zychaea mexicana TaxID=64656 RepID=UPI0022FEED00|nr:uncharacterized protein BDB00DRAFT_792689 [Zychaea mexicana]KAI9484668.1 hypothetical protein BDB00DRAFT_792689 [Zychaea mexicana]
MPDVLTSSSAFRRRHRAGSAQLLRRTTEYDSNNSNCLLHNSSDDQHDARRGSKRFLKWTACFAFVTKFKRSKSEKLDFISEIEPGRRRSSNSNNYRSSSSCPAAVDVAQDQQQQQLHEKQLLALSSSPLQQRHTMNNHNRRPFSQYLERPTSMDPDQDSIASTLLQWKEGTGSLPVSPLSALSPPPRHAMKERSRSLTAEEDTLSEVPPLPMPRKRKATTISRSLALRLSLDVDQQYYSSSGITHSSSGFSNGTSSDFLKRGDHDEEDDTASSVSSSQQQQQRASSGAILHNNNSTTPEAKLRLSSIEPSSTSTLDLHKDPQQRRQQHRVSPITIPEIDTLKDRQQQEEEDESSDYGDLINEFRLPSEKLPNKQQQQQEKKQQSISSSSSNDKDDDDSDDNSSTVAVPATVVEVQKNREASKEVSKHPLDTTQENNNSYYYFYDSNSNNGPPKPFVSRSTITARDLSRQKAMEALEGHFAALEPTGSKSMDIVRDKAHYDAVVAGTMHRRPYTQYLRAQPDAKEEEEEDNNSSGLQQQTTTTIDQQKEKKNARYVKASSAVFAGYNSKLYRPSLVFFPPSPNSINSDY